MQVYCKAEDGGGWTLIYRTKYGSNPPATVTNSEEELDTADSDYSIGMFATVYMHCEMKHNILNVQAFHVVLTYLFDASFNNMNE